MKHPIRRRVLYGLFRTVQAIASLLPLEWMRAIGRMAAHVAYACLPAQRRLMDEHLRIAFGSELTARQRRGIARGVFLNLGQTAMEWLCLPRLSTERMQRLITVEGLDNLRRAVDQGRGVLACSPHFGNWEFGPIYLRSLGFDGAALARKLRYPEYEAFLINMRARKGVVTHERGSLREVARLLREGKIIGLLPDQDTAGLEGVFVEFFGRPAYTPVGPAALSLMTGAAIVPCFLVREGSRFRFVIEPAVGLAQPVNDRRQAIVQLTQAWSSAMERMIRLHPEQWVWMHRRWKTTPETLAAQTGAGASGGPGASGLRLPAAVAVMLAGGLLVAVSGGCGGKPKAADKSASTAQHVIPDQQMDTFTLTGYGDDGGKRWELEGTEASLEDDIVTVQKPNGVGYDAQRRAFLTAKTALVHQRSRNVTLKEDVSIHTSDGVWFYAPDLDWIPDVERARTDSPVRIETDHMLLRGRGFDGMTHLKQARIQTDIEVVLNPTEEQRPAGAPKQVTITCKGPLDFEYSKGLVTFHDDVHVIDANGELFSDLLVAHLNPDGRTIRYAEATGNVRILQQGHNAVSERAIYEPSKGKISLVGKPSLLLVPEPGQEAFSLKDLSATAPGAPRKPESASAGSAAR